jgi:nucleoside-diphosphate-sugar epimerase
VARFAASSGVAVVLRLSSLYGPRASMEYVRAIGDGRLPSLGRGDNYVSQLHTEDAGGAVGLCVRIPGGTYNVSEDEPLIARDNLETLVVALGVKRPRRVPTLLAKAVAGSTVNLLTVSQRISNRRFKSVSGWAPKYPSVATGWPAVVAEANQPKHEN